MSVAPSVKRITSTATDFSTAGLDAIAYYLRLYAVEQLLTIQDRTSEETKYATDLLDIIESFKNDVSNDDADEDSKAGLQLLLTDQKKARIYTSNFTISLYNTQLKQVQNGPWNSDLGKGLWCCIDLFNTVLHLWSDSINEETVEAIKKRTKICKLYISKLAKGELGKEVSSASTGEENAKTLELDVPVDNTIGNDTISVNTDKDVNDNTVRRNSHIPPTEEEIRRVIEESKREEQEELEKNKDDRLSSIGGSVNLEEDEAVTEEGEIITINDEEALSMTPIEFPKKTVSSDESTESIITAPKKFPKVEDEKEDEETVPSLGLPNVSSLPTPTFIDDSTSENEEPEFLDDMGSENDKDIIEKRGVNLDTEEDPIEKDEVTTRESSNKKVLQKEDLNKMMDRTSKIEKVQKLAKFVVSALNYEDIQTAKDELTQALEILNSL